MFSKKNKKFDKNFKNWKFTCNVFPKNTKEVIILKLFWQKNKFLYKLFYV